MMQKILLLGRHDMRADYDTAQSMANGLRKFAPESVEYIACDYEDLIIQYDTLLTITTADGTDLRNFDIIFQFGWFKTKLLEDLAHSVAKYAEFYKVQHLNQEALDTRSRTKISQYVIAGLLGVRTIPFIIATDSKAITDWVKGQPLPVIVKAVAASKGNHNYLAQTTEDIDCIIRDNPDQQFVVQPFIENDGDYRLIVLDGVVKLAIHRKGETGSHLNNTSKGGAGTIADISELPKPMLDEAVLLSRELRREISGIDMVISKKDSQHYFLESNNMPQLSTGSNVDAKLAVINEYLISRLSQ